MTLPISFFGRLCIQSAVLATFGALISCTGARLRVPVAILVDEPSTANAAPSHQHGSLIQERVWDVGLEHEYRDRNGDGIIDWEATGNPPGTPGSGFYREDLDYDGYFDREYEAGGEPQHVSWENRIHEPVPDSRQLPPPTRVIQRPKSSAVIQ